MANIFTDQSAIYLMQSGWFFVFLFFGTVFIFSVSWYFGAKARRKSSLETPKLDSMFVGSIFGFSAFLIAFQLSGSTQIFENIRRVTLEEFSAVTGLIQDIGRLPMDKQEHLNKMLKEYLDHRVDLFERPFSLERFEQGAIEQKHLGRKIANAVQDWPQQSDHVQRSIVLEMQTLVRSMNSAFEKVNISVYTHSLHVFWRALVVLLAMSVGIAGYKTGLENREHWFCTLLFLSVTIGAIVLCVHLGNPRIGFIELDVGEGLLRLARERLN